MTTLDWRDALRKHGKGIHRECKYLDWGWGDGFPRCTSTDRRIAGTNADGPCECGDWDV